MPTLEAVVYNGGGVNHTGDAHVQSTGIPYNPIQSAGWAGRDGKAAEVNLFFAFDTTSVPLGSRLDGLRFRITVAADADGEGNIRIGFLEEDGTWEVNGFARPGDAASGPTYARASLFPNDGTAIPHATQNGELGIEAGILVNGAWATGNMLFNAATWPQAAMIHIGSSALPVDYDEPLFLTVFNQLRNHEDRPVVAFTVDSQAVALSTRVRVLMAEATLSTIIPKLLVEYTLNPPVFTTTPKTTATLGMDYVSTAIADPYELGDQTDGNFVDVVYSLEGTEGVDFPTGMTAAEVGGVFNLDWTPTESQLGLNTVTIRATNEGGEFLDLVFDIGVNLKVEGGVVPTAEPHAITATAEPHAASATAEPHAVKAAAEPHAITVTTQGGPLSVTFVEPALTIEED